MSKDDLKKFKRTVTELLARGQQEKLDRLGRKLHVLSNYIQFSAFKYSVA